MMTKFQIKIMAVGIALTLFAIQNHVHAAPFQQQPIQYSSGTLHQEQPKPMKFAIKKVTQILFPE
ncbi:hypothetical protein SAMN05444972_11456 [Marininema halotolerans]|uniref:Uncharacterized protein n=2 Tax=Marininema halotolerans TaxID=1155944 RepID=A0A1I6U8W5_9BACL|nr:hypothetical protein SAMN05444972_11456 [Marininema halotolerans]